ncbi:hypothetical protein AXA44_15095 [Rhodococcus sp. SC4]|nr:hypothetical protein AXA44_15095 [Rhodococcus sp. SC4]
MELAKYDRGTTPVVGSFRRYLHLRERDGFMLRDRDRLEIRHLLQRGQGGVTSTAVSLTGFPARFLGLICAAS